MSMFLTPSYPNAKQCPACDSGNTDAELALYDWAYTREGPFAYSRCNDCGALYATEELSPAALERYYPRHYAAYVDDAAFGLIRGTAHRVGMAKRCRTIEQLCQGGRLLDIGCGAGAFLRAMQARGPWNVIGLERDQKAVKLARDSGLDVHWGDIATSNLAGAFDVITLWDVIEHLERPRDILRRIAGWLAVDGWLILRTPDAASRQARWFGARWAGYDPPRHRVIYSFGALEILARRCGLALWQVPGPQGSSALASLSMRNLALAHEWPHWLAESQIHPLVQIAWWPACAFWDAIEGGAELVVAAKRLGTTNHPYG